MVLCREIPAGEAFIVSAGYGPIELRAEAPYLFAGQFFNRVFDMRTHVFEGVEDAQIGR